MEAWNRIKNSLLNKPSRDATNLDSQIVLSPLPGLPEPDAATLDEISIDDGWRPIDGDLIEMNSQDVVNIQTNTQEIRWQNQVVGRYEIQQLVIPNGVAGEEVFAVSLQDEGSMLPSSAIFLPPTLDQKRLRELFYKGAIPQQPPDASAAPFVIIDENVDGLDNFPAGHTRVTIQTNKLKMEVTALRSDNPESPKSAYFLCRYYAKVEAQI